MADTIVTQQDISNLATKLDELGDVLSEKERTLLLAVFKLASLELGSRLQGAPAAQASAGTQTESGRAVSGARSSIGIGIGDAGRSSSTGTSSATVSALPSLSEGFKNAFTAIGANNISVTPDFNKAAGGVGVGVIW